MQVSSHVEREPQLFKGYILGQYVQENGIKMQNIKIKIRQS